jgi:surface antigen
MAGDITGTTTPRATPVQAVAATTVKRSQVAELQNGMDRAAVEAVLGKPNSVMAIQGTDDAIETLTYNLDDKATARVRMVNGRVVSVQFAD